MHPRQIQILSLVLMLTLFFLRIVNLNFIYKYGPCGHTGTSTGVNDTTKAHSKSTDLRKAFF